MQESPGDQRLEVEIDRREGRGALWAENDLEAPDPGALALAAPLFLLLTAMFRGDIQHADDPEAAVIAVIGTDASAREIARALAGGSGLARP